jgi:hypothetical protein
VPNTLHCPRRRPLERGPLERQYRPDKAGRDLKTLLKCRLWSATAERLNGPYEFYGLSLLEHHAELKAEFKRTGVTCFCRSLKNPLLWSDYANGRPGFAIGYDPAPQVFWATGECVCAFCTMSVMKMFRPPLKF